MPQISVIVPVYKVEKYIHRCVDSILAQTFTGFELILVDDGSPDNCGAICDEYATKDSRVVVIHQENGGLSAARNAGIDWVFGHSDSQWLTFVDSDDWVHPKYLELLFRAVRDTETGVSICRYLETDGAEPDTSAPFPAPSVREVETFFVEHTTNATVAWGKLYAKECFQTIRYPVGKIHEDEYVTYRILFQFEQIAFVPSPLYCYFINPEGITKRPWTPKRLDAIEAFLEQKYYFKESGLGHAYAMAEKNYIWGLCNYLGHLSSPDLQCYSHIYIRSLRKQLVLALLRNYKEYPFIQENLWIYSRAFPGIMNIYWFILGQWQKIVGKRK